MFHRNRFHLFYLLISCVWVLPDNRTEAIDDRCSLHCTTPELRGGEMYAKCKTSVPLKLNCSSEEFSHQLRNVSFLDLSHNSLKEAPRRIFPYCTSLKILTLAGNNVTNIESGTFKDLRSLKTLNLSFNNLRKWKVNLNDELQSLSNIDVTGNRPWLPSQQLLSQLKNLTTVQGVTWTKYCGNCLLTRLHVNKTGLNPSCSRFNELSSPSAWSWHEQIQYGRALDFIKAGFWPTCLCDDVCHLHQFRLPNRKEYYYVSYKGSLSLFLLGSLGILANTTVVLVILFNRSLRGDTAATLVCNVAVCDVFIGIVSIVYAIFHNIKIIVEDFHELFEGRAENRCDYRCKMQMIQNIAGPILMTTIISHACGSFVMVVEKFLKIVFPMKPNIWLERRGVLLSLFVSWLVALSYSVLPIFGVGGMVYNGFIPSDPHGIVFLTFVLLTLVQCSSLLLHLPILIVARRSAVSFGIRRETTIAKKLALLVFTNLVFFTCPVVLGAIWVVRHKNLPKIPLEETQWLVFTLTAFPFICVSINCALNPFLYALRHPKIKRQLKTLYTSCRTAYVELSSAIIYHARCNTNVVHVEN